MGKLVLTFFSNVIWITLRWTHRCRLHYQRLFGKMSLHSFPQSLKTFRDLSWEWIKWKLSLHSVQVGPNWTSSSCFIVYDFMCEWKAENEKRMFSLSIKVILNLLWVTNLFNILVFTQGSFSLISYHLPYLTKESKLEFGLYLNDIKIWSKLLLSNRNPVLNVRNLMYK